MSETISLKTTNNQVEIEGLLYKIGIRGMVFVYTDCGWLRSQKEPRELQRAINERDNGHKKARQTVLR